MFSDQIDSGTIKCNVTLASVSCTSQINMCSDCNCDQAEYEGFLCEIAQIPFDWFSDFKEDYLEYALVTLGLSANSLLLMTLLQRTFRTSLMFTYIRLLAGIGLMSALVQLSHKLTAYCKLDRSCDYFGAVFVRLHPYLEDSFKLWFASFSLFLCLDRFLAVGHPDFYSKVNNRKFVAFGCSVSALLACVGLTPFANYQFVYRWRWQTYTVSARHAGNDIRASLPEKLVFAVRLLELLLLIGLTSTTVRRLQWREKRLRTSLLLDELAQRVDRKLIGLCRFQILEASVVVLDLALACLNDLAFMFSSATLSPERQAVSHTHFQYLRSFPALLLYYWSGVFKMASTQLSYAVLLTAFISCNKTFRQTFVKVITCRCRLANNAISVTTLNQVSEAN